MRDKIIKKLDFISDSLKDLKEYRKEYEDNNISEKERGKFI